MSHTAAPINLGHPLTVAVSIQTYAPESFDLEKPLVVTDVINPNTMLLPENTDLVDDDKLETLRTAWKNFILTPHAMDITHGNPDSETLTQRAFQKVAAEIGDSSLVALVQEARFPIPPDYTISLAPKSADTNVSRLKTIETLVPFRNLRNMLLRCEQEWDLPVATVRMASQRIEMPAAKMN
ncbi:MAG: hypothetical protein HRT94_06870 [Alphaproteobacteria bacterium]|nr:hypothetical protein [Alphaproteobacteria bacterium]